MSAYALTQQAKDDLRTIARYTANRWGTGQRNRYIKLLDDAFQLLADLPQAGQPCPWIRRSYRKFPSGSHIIFYRAHANDDGIEIVRILHKSMDVEDVEANINQP